MTSILKYRIYCTTDSVYRYWYLPNTSPVPTTCPDNTGHSINSALTVIIETIDDDVVDTNAKKNNYSETIVTEYDPIIQNTFTGNIINEQLYQIELNNGATIASVNNALQITLSTTVGSEAIIQSQKVLKYIPGYSIHISGTAKFASPIAGSRQFFGAYSEKCDILIGYSGTSFVIRYSTDGYVHIERFTVTTAANSNETGTVTLNGVAYNVSLTNASGVIPFTASQISKGNSFGNLWNAQQVGNTIVFTAKRSGLRNGTYSFSSTGGAVASRTTLVTGVSKTVTEIDISQWNGDSNLLTSIVPTNINMYELEYSWYGSGNFSFSIYNPFTFRFEKLHTFYFANQQTSVSIINPHMYLTYLVQSISSSTAITATFVGTFGAYLGKRTFTTSPLESMISAKNFASGIERNMIAFRTRLQANNSVLNASMLIRRMFFTNESTRTTVFRVYLDPATIGAGLTTDYTNFQYVDENQSFAIFDTTSLTKTGGTLIYQVPVSASNTFELSFFDDTIEVDKNETILITAEILSGNASDVQVSIAYSDFF